MHDWPFVSDGELFRSQVSRTDMIAEDCQRDDLRMGYLIRPGSRLFTILVLRGCDLQKQGKLRISDIIKPHRQGIV